jgi:hypothetical protein
MNNEGKTVCSVYVPSFFLCYAIYPNYVLKSEIVCKCIAGCLPLFLRL